MIEITHIAILCFGGLIYISNEIIVTKFIAELWGLLAKPIWKEKTMASSDNDLNTQIINKSLLHL